MLLHYIPCDEAETTARAVGLFRQSAAHRTLSVAYGVRAVPYTVPRAVFGPSIRDVRCDVRYDAQGTRLGVCPI
jgi:hypothetical protein